MNAIYGGLCRQVVRYELYLVTTAAITIFTLVEQKLRVGL